MYEQLPFFLIVFDGYVMYNNEEARFTTTFTARLSCRFPPWKYSKIQPLSFSFSSHPKSSPQLNLD